MPYVQETGVPSFPHRIDRDRAPKNPDSRNLPVFGVCFGREIWLTQSEGGPRGNHQEQQILDESGITKIPQHIPIYNVTPLSYIYIYISKLVYKPQKHPLTIVS